MASPTRILIVVPARGGSKRLPGKNLRRLGGKPLIEWTLDAARGAKLDATCLLTTDDENIRKKAENLGYWVPFLRPSRLADGEASSESAVLHALDRVNDIWGQDPELLMLLQPTTPFRSSSDIRRAVAILETTPMLDAVVSVKTVNRNPAQLFVPDGDNLLRPLGTGQENVYTPNGALYLSRSPAFRQRQTFIQPATSALRTAPDSDIDIDTADDWVQAETALQRWQGKNGIRKHP